LIAPVIGTLAGSGAAGTTDATHARVGCWQTGDKVAMLDSAVDGTPEYGVIIPTA